MVSGATTHGGALLAPLGVRFVVAQEGDLPATVEAVLDAQVDLDREGASGLIIYRNAVRVPPAAVFPAADAVGAIVASADLGAIEQLPSLRLPALDAVEGGWAGEAPAPGTVVVSTEFGPDWELEGSDGADRRTSRGVRMVDGVRCCRGVGPCPLHGAMGAHRGDARAGAALAWRPCGSRGSRCLDEVATARHAGDARPGTGPPLARGARRGRGRRVRAPARCRPPATRASRTGDVQLRRLVLPARRGSEAMEGHAVPREPRRRGRVVARVSSFSTKKPATPQSVTVPPQATVSVSVPAKGREASTYVEYFDGWIAASWVAQGGGGEIGVGAEPCAAATGATWFAPDGTTEQGEDAYLVVMNPFAVDAVFDVVLYTPKRAPIRSSALTDHVLRPGKSVAFRLNAFAEGEAAVGAEVDVSLGRVAVSSLGITRDGGIRSVIGTHGDRPDHAAAGGRRSRRNRRSTSSSRARTSSTSARRCCRARRRCRPAGSRRRVRTRRPLGRIR